MYEDLAYSFWLPAGYNTMVTFHAIVGRFYAFIFSHRIHRLLEGVGFLSILHIAYRLSSLFIYFFGIDEMMCIRQYTSNDCNKRQAGMMLLHIKPKTLWH